MKKSRLLEIIREEITSALKEAATTYAGKSAVDDLKDDKAFGGLSGDAKADAIEKLSSGGTVTIGEEEQLNEMAYDIIIAQPDKLAKLQDEIKDSTKKGQQKLAKALDIIQKTKKAGKPIRQRDIANEMGVIQQEINPLINKLIDVGILEKGESVTGVTKKKVTDKAQGKPAKEKAPKEKTTAASKAEPMDGEDKEATQNIGSDSTAKELGKASSRKDRITKAYKELEPQVKEKIAQSKAGDAEAADWLKNTWTPILQAYRKAQTVNV